MMNLRMKIAQKEATTQGKRLGGIDQIPEIEEKNTVLPKSLLAVKVEAEVEVVIIDEVENIEVALKVAAEVPREKIEKVDDLKVANELETILAIEEILETTDELTTEKIQEVTDRKIEVERTIESDGMSGMIHMRTEIAQERADTAVTPTTTTTAAVAHHLGPIQYPNSNLIAIIPNNLQMTTMKV